MTAMRRRHITQVQIEQRTEILRSISQQEPLGESAMQMLSISGFRDLFLRLKDYYPNNIEAYEALEEEHIRIFGERKYSEYDSFRSASLQNKPKKKG